MSFKSKFKYFYLNIKSNLKGDTRHVLGNMKTGRDLPISKRLHMGELLVGFHLSNNFIS